MSICSAIGRKLIRFLIVVWLVITVCFVVLRALPGDAIEAQLTQVGASTGDIEERRHQLGLDESVLIQYLSYLGNILHGDFGVSFYSGQSVQDLIVPRASLSFQLAISGLLIASIAGVSLGIIASLAIRGLSSTCKVIISLLYSVPIFWTGTLALFLLNLSLSNRLIIPSLILGLHGSAEIARVMQTSLTNGANEPHIIVARAKGLSNKQVFWKHRFKLAIISVIPVIALQAGFLLSGTVIIETVFNLAGIGKLLFNATLDQDYALVQAITVWLVASYMAVITVGDLLLNVLDSRVRNT